MNQSRERTTAAAPTLYLDRGEGRVAYDVQGPVDAPLVLCAPGMGDLRQLYRFTVPVLLEAGYRVATMDLRGHGESDATFTSFGDAAAASDLLALAQQLGATTDARAVLFGNSMCSAAAVIAAADRPDLLAAIVLAGPFVRNPPRTKVTSLKTLAMRLALMRPWGLACWLTYYAGLYPTSKPADFADYKATMKASLKRPAHWRAFVATTKQATHALAEARLRGVRTPALVLMGTKDPDFKDPAAEAAFVGGTLSGDVVMVEGAGHYVMAEFPDVVNPRVLQFVREVVGA
jgi:pimeloyl-ACP methyl ester carboxylesterase